MSGKTNSPSQVSTRTINSEYELIEKMAPLLPAGGKEVLMGIGDDAAVIKQEESTDLLTLVTTDMLVENVHFSRRWATAFQVGFKAAACNLSDIAAMGGTARWMFLSLALPTTTPETWVLSFCKGLKAACKPYRVAVAGGDTCKGGKMVISIALIGTVEKGNLCLRNQATPGDLLVVTGNLGASAAGLALLEKGLSPHPHLKEKHLSPGCRLDIAATIAPLANAMIDISDGLASETGHICRQSKVGALLYADTIPQDHQTLEAAQILGVDPLQFALNGGEDFELLFTISPRNMKILEQKLTGLTCIGKIVESPGIRLVNPDGTFICLEDKGFDHFASK